MDNASKIYMQNQGIISSIEQQLESLANIKESVVELLKKHQHILPMDMFVSFNLIELSLDMIKAHFAEIREKVDSNIENEPMQIALQQALTIMHAEIESSLQLLNEVDEKLATL